MADLFPAAGFVGSESFGPYLPPSGSLKESSSPALEVSPYAGRPITLDQHVRAQVFQSRYKYFIFGEMYRRHVWIRSAIDYIARRATRDPNRLIDDLDPLNPDVADLREFLDDASPDYDFQALYYGWIVDLLKYGQAYSYVERNGAGEPVAIWPLDSRITYPITDRHGTIMVHCHAYNGVVEFLERSEILYFSINNNGSDVRALPIMETLVDSVALELNADKFNASLFEHGLNVGAVFTMPGATEEEVEDNIRFLEDKYTKPENAHRHLILRGDAKMLRDGMQTQKEIMFEELVRVSRFKVCAAFGVPESLMGIPDKTNRATADTHERETYVNTVRPIRRLLNRQFTRNFIRNMWGSKSVRLEEPLNSMLPTDKEIESVGKIMDIGGNFNDIQEMLGFARVPWGDYYIMRNPAVGGLARLDYSMPGLGYAQFDVVAYQTAHDAEQQQAQSQAALTGQPPAAPETPYAPPAPQYQIQKDPIAARIIDVSRSEDEAGHTVWSVDELAGQAVYRRDPIAPNTRGGSGYVTKTGRFRYGPPPRGSQPKTQDSSGAPSQNDLTNPRDFNLPKNLTPEERLAIDSARSQVSVLLRQAQDENWSNDEFFNRLQESGWNVAPGKDIYLDTRDAKTDARRLSELYPDKAYTIVGSDGHYQIMEKDLSALAAENNAAQADKGGMEAQSARQQGRIDAGKPALTKAQSRAPHVARSMGGLDEWKTALRAFSAAEG